MNATTIRNYGLLFLVPLVIVAVIVTSLAIGSAGSGGDPDVGLSDSARDAKYDDLRATSVAQTSDIVRNFLASGRDVSSLPRLPSLISYDVPLLTPREARDRARRVVRGIVAEQRLEIDASRPGEGKVVSTIRVSETLKGDSQESLASIEQHASLSLDSNGEFVLVVDDADPPVGLGTDVIVFMEASSGDRNRPIPVTSASIESDGTLHPNEFNPQFAGLHGRPAAELLTSLRSR